MAHMQPSRDNRTRRIVVLGGLIALLATTAGFVLATTVTGITATGQGYYSGTVGIVAGIAGVSDQVATASTASYSSAPISADVASVFACATASGCVLNDVAEQVIITYTTQASAQTFTVLVTVGGSGGGPWFGSVLTFHDDGSHTVASDTITITVDLGAPGSQTVSSVTVVLNS